MSERIGVIGLGRMGRAIAARLVHAGMTVSGWTRSGLDPEEAAALGIAAAGTLDDLVSAADMLILSLIDDAAVSDVLGRLATFDLDGRLVVETSTVSPATVRAAAAAIETAGGRIVDAPISGGPEMVRDGTIGLFVGGAPRDVARFAPIAARLSDRVVAVGGLGAGHAAKIVNNVALGGVWQVMIEAMRLGGRLGLDLEKSVDILRDSPAAPPSFRTRIPKILGEDSEVGFPVSGVLKDQRLFLAIAEEIGEPLPALSAACENFEKAAASGHAEDDLAVGVAARVTGR